MKQDTLTKLDNYFDQKSESETQLTFLICAALIGCILWFLFMDPAEQFYNSELDNHNNIEKKLNDTREYLASVSSPDGSDRNFKINQETAILQQMTTQYDKTVRLNEYFDQKLRELSFLLFNKGNWANFLDKVVLLAKENDIKILQLKNDIKAPNFQKIEQVLNISVGFIGNFQNILNYINSLEETKLVVDMHQLEIIDKGGYLGSDLNISVWGMRY